MKKIVENISIIHNNIFVLTPLLISFYKNYKGQKNDLLLSYLILPIVLNPKCIEELKVVRSNSNLVRLVANKECMAGFAERFEFYKQIANQCLQYAIDCKYIIVTKELQIKVVNSEGLYTDPSLSNSITLASNLHNLFKSLDVINIYYAFGIKNL
jgi:hypothetical protein